MHLGSFCWFRINQPFRVNPAPCKRGRGQANTSLLLPVRRDNGINTAGIQHIPNFSCVNVQRLTLWLSAVMPRLTSSVSNSRLGLGCEDSADVTRTKQKSWLTKKQWLFSVDMIKYFLWQKLQKNTIFPYRHACLCLRICCSWHPVSVSRADTLSLFIHFSSLFYIIFVAKYW